MHACTHPSCTPCPPAVLCAAPAAGWAGIVINGCVRDGETIAGFDIGVKALGLNPQKPGKKHSGTRDIPITFSGVTINPGEMLYADEGE